MAQATPTAPDPEQAARDALKKAQCARRWIAELNQSEKAQAKWLTRSRKIVRRYKEEHRSDGDQRRFAMLWSNTQTLQPAIYSRPPQPVVSRRFADSDPIARVASEVLERALAYSIDCQGFDGVMRQSSFDYVLLARGQTWERYVPTKGPMVTPEIELQVKTEGDGYLDPDGNDYEGETETREDGSVVGFGEPYAPITYEESVTDYVNWEDFGHSVARTWDEVDYVWRRVYLNRAQLKERFGDELGERIPLDFSPKAQQKQGDTSDLTNKAAIYEIWCKSEKKVYWISKSFNEAPLDERDDPLQLEGFFPCPRPLLGTTANDSVIPLPDFVFYQDQAEEIDKLTARIAHLQDALKVRGFYAADQKSNLNNLLNSDNNILIPVTDWQSLKEDGGVRNKIEWWPIDLVVNALNALITQRTQLINDVYQITGIADILRGMNDPRATAAAEQIKTAWGTLRIRDRQVEVMRFARDVIRIKGQVIAKEFNPDTLKAMTGVQLPTNSDKAQVQAQIQQLQQQAQLAGQQAQLAWQAQAQASQQQGQPPPPKPAPPAPPQIPDELQAVLRSPSWEDVTALLRNKVARQFRIDIETDSTIEPNQTEEKQQAVELIGAVGQMVMQWGPAIQAQPALAPMVGEFIKWGVRRFRAGRQLEDVIDNTVDKMTAAASQPQAPQGPQQPPVDQTKLAVASIEQQTEQMAQQAETQRVQMQLGVKQQEIAQRAEETQAKIYALPRDPTPQVAV
jgi:hypothetical protein